MYNQTYIQGKAILALFISDMMMADNCDLSLHRSVTLCDELYWLMTIFQ